MMVRIGDFFLLLLCFVLSSDAATLQNQQDNYSTSSESYGSGVRDDMVDWSKHPCRRDCTRHPNIRMTCRYGLTIELYSSMSKACYDCPRMSQDCARKHCIVADGYPKVVVVANRQLPGSTIEVCEGDRVLVDVTNDLPTDTTSIHWHGLHQKKSPHMDGVPYVTQCPILPGQTFRYEFEAEQAGTFVWHSHSGEQRADGLFGALIVRPTEIPRKTHDRRLYDLDEHVIVINEWTKLAAMYSYVLEHQNGYPQLPHTILVNGLGRWAYGHAPTPVFKVQKGKRYRFRLINVGSQNCPIMVYVEKHTMITISSDGADIEPVKVDAIRILSGERYDFVIEANQPVDDYRIHFEGESWCLTFNCHQVAVLRYDGATEDYSITRNINKDYLAHKNHTLRILNPFNQGTEVPTALSIPTLNSSRAIDDDEDDDYSGPPDHRFFVSYDFFPLDHDNYHRKNLYGYNQVGENKRSPSLQVNRITFKMPNFPVLTQPELITPDLFCDSTTKNNCNQEFCQCTQVLRARLNSLVEIVMLDEGSAVANHPMHLHGYHFRVVAMEKVSNNISVDKFEALDRAGKVQRKLKDAPLKDTVLVPTGGYTILRLRADNPGYWFFHCHIDNHASNGMALILKVGEHKDFPAVPKDFPKCYGSRRKT